MHQFRSKVDAWFYLLFPVIFFTIGFASIEPWQQGDMVGVYGSVLVGALVLGFQTWLLKTRYIVSKYELLVISGPIRWKVPRADITSVVPTRSFLSAPALSLDRLQVNYGDGQKLLVSPEDKAGFLAALDIPA